MRPRQKVQSNERQHNKRQGDDRMLAACCGGHAPQIDFQGVHLDLPY